MSDPLHGAWPVFNICLEACLEICVVAGVDDLARQFHMRYCCHVSRVLFCVFHSALLLPVGMTPKLRPGIKAGAKKGGTHRYQEGCC